ncbi:MAG: glycosyltransferase family 4 protein [Sedimentisphaerales bacterium]|nr:glycosyltransferase family 4 protein [Sedimentisphaerales bacterium]
MKIVFFDFITKFGGGPQLAADLAKRLSANHDVEVIDAYGICEPYLRTLKEAGIRVHIMVPEADNVYIGYHKQKLRRLWRMICQIIVFLRLRKRLIEKVCEINPDVIWSNGRFALLVLGISFRLRHYPFAMEIIMCPDPASIYGWQKWLMKHRVSVLMAISTETAKQLKLTGVKKDRIHVVFDTIDIADTLKRSTQTLKTPLPGLEGQPRILIPAFLIRKKGQDTAIKAIARLKSEGLNPTLWLAGDVVMNDKSYLGYLQNLVKDLGVSQNVYFLGWRDDVPAIMVQADMVVLPSHEEGFGHVILEAMLLKRPAIATHVGGIKDSIQDGINGLNFPVSDDEALAGCIKKVIADREFADKLTQNGYKTITETFSPENHTRRFIEGLNLAIMGTFK